ncbi:hypothetical protein EMIHUDRAFT_221331 [Emiliania huxleyi CCMP1516]|uniref:CCHC-type domain-containing protein n=2 Tax=Emiliania huxleyi TaxID=2903 RepID=A0A0D3HYZ1_EMIH1|nr:hypothetical protein EMIHUDRAFT_221331 [Emiliania huxleyi CCMP1516]EOD04226.1 hypothetical protein EMIHUDRAFT_221331 [Emiliania huxleyi CCMP1516]|eukprot:XP_005756655.1 hypothetical protein EMIHUDRAFT_221331 [Emiliania huxleyi CCMP1516]
MAGSNLDHSLQEIINDDKPTRARATNGRAKSKACNNCGVIGHLAGACPDPAQCHACGSTAHVVADCPHTDETCDICGRVGHLAVKCRRDDPR